MTPEEKKVLIFLDKLVTSVPEAKVYSNFIQNALKTSLTYDIGFSHAILQIEKELDDSKSIFEWERPEWLSSIKKKVSELAFLDRLIMLSGLSSFREDIMTEYIKNVFSKTPEKQQVVQLKSEPIKREG